MACFDTDIAVFSMFCDMQANSNHYQIACPDVRKRFGFMFSKDIRTYKTDIPLLFEKT